MKKLKYLTLTLVLVFSIVTSFSQNHRLDSLRSLLKSASDSSRRNAIRKEAYLNLSAEGRLHTFKLKNRKQALDSYELAFFIAPGLADETDYYNAACAAALTGDSAKAMTYLTLAIDKGWNDIELISEDEDLLMLHGSEAWDSLILRVRKRIDEVKPIMYWGIYFGILFMLFLYNLLLLITLRERHYLYYILFLFVYASIELARSSVLSAYLPPVLSWLDYLNPRSGKATFCVSILGLIYLLFSSSLLELKQNAPSFNKWMNRLMILAVVIMLLVYFVHFSGTIFTFFTVLTSFFIPLTFAIRLYFKGYKAARYFVIGNLFFLVGIFWSILPITKLIQSTTFLGVFHPDNVGSVLFFSMLSMALGDKINILKKDKIEAQEKAMLLLEEKVEERTLEVRKQKHLVEEKQKEILDSIAYAKRLQEAILPPQDFINTHTPENFVLYKPKDIVAGDFYWAEKIEDKFYIAAADSTGHGVPGALVSVVCSNALNRSVKEFKIRETGQILDKARQLVIETFEKSTSEVKDGMDVSLLCMDLKSRKVTWSGANNPIWYIEKNEIKEIKADKQPIGKTDNPKPFTTNEINCSPGTVFYLFTDGLADQFGGPNGKKYKYKQFSDLLSTIHNLPMDRQKLTIGESFDSWKGDLEQVDDVCVIGIKI